MNQMFTNPIETDSFQTKNGETVTVHFIQHASLYFIYEGITIYADPVNYEGVDYKKFPKADVILITHDHYDHLDKNAIADISKPSTQIYCNKTVQEALETGFVLKNSELITYKNVKSGHHFYIDIEAVPAYNTTEGRDKFHPKGRDNGYIITLRGTRIYIPGDCEDMPEMAEFKDIDVAFLPINQPYTMTVEQAINAAKTIKPKILYPIHYSDTDLKGLSVLKEEGIEVRVFKM
jgi:L-ascorbate metabolism protein UlaG (beta-lactamase superfamily)